MAVPVGWTRIPTQAFGTHVGPFYKPEGGGHLLFGFLADAKHGNKRGVTHGGMIATAFDVALGNACWEEAGQKPCATIQLNIHYVGALALGEFAQVAVEVVRTAKTMVFVRGTMAVDGRVVAAADGVWKILNWRGEYVPPPLPPQG